MKNSRYFLSTTAVVLAVSLHAGQAEAINITPSSDSFGLANTLFLNSGGLAIQSAQFLGEFGQAGTYQNPQGTYGLPNVGIALSSGLVSDYATGPNTDTGTTTSFSDDFGEEFSPKAATPEQEALLFPITGTSNHNDVAQLNIEFFVPDNISEVTFFGTFGSEEWPEFVGSFNDGFGLYVNDVNVAGAEVTTEGAGVSVGSNLPVNIDHPDMRDIAGTELDGILAPDGNPVLRFDVPVNSGQINTFNILVADALDDALDTTVYLSSFFSESSPAEETGATEFDPVLPASVNPITGAFTIPFPEDAVDGQVVWIDPPVSVGFEYEVAGGAAFSSLVAPSLATVADVDGYFITVDGVSIPLTAGGSLDFMAAFGMTPTEFTLTGIDPALMLDPENPLAFPLGVSLTGISGTQTVTMTPITEDIMAPIPLPAAAWLYLLALGLGGVVLRRRTGRRT